MHSREYDTHDTIVARASAVGGSPRGVVRISGPVAVDLFLGLAPLSSAPRRAVAIDVLLDIELSQRPFQVPATAMIWSGTRSYTREPIVELHTIGSSPVIEAIVLAAIKLGARLAAPGEFTLRAFLAGRIDLTQAEAVLAAIDASSATALKTALGQLAGGMAEPLAQLRADLVNLLADIEAGLDFVEDDIEFVTGVVVCQRLDAATARVKEMTGQLARRSVGDDLPLVALVGLPNAGKSQLFNSLVERFGIDHRVTTAIVSPTPGTTRDALLATLEVTGTRFVLCDTAGIEETLALEPSPRMVAQQATNRSIELASLCVRCTSAAEFDDDDAMFEPGVLPIVTKADLWGDNALCELLATSSHTGAGLNDLARRIAQELNAAAYEGLAKVVPHTAARCAESLAAAAVSLAAARELTAISAGDELVAVEIRTALEHLGAVAGTVSSDDVLEQVFSRFCIGK